KWPFDKFIKADKTLGTKMKATGEVMALASTVEEGLMKGIRSLELDIDRLELPHLKKLGKKELIAKISEKTDEGMFIVAECMRRGLPLESIYNYTNIDRFFLNVVWNIIEMESKLQDYSLDTLDIDTLKEAKDMGFTDIAIGHFIGASEEEIRDIRNRENLTPIYKKVNTCAAEYRQASPYYFSTYVGEDELEVEKNKKVVVIGSGPIRIGQGIEFDYCSVHGVWALKSLGYETIMINNNPETVSTDFDTADKLYFEPLTSEDVLNILDIERPVGVIVQFGGQTAIKLVEAISDAGYTILGTQPQHINEAEDREEFDKLLNRLNISRPKGITVFTTKKAVAGAEKLGYPVLVRPSYVLGGQGMEI